MKKSLLMALFLLLIAGCASTDRMVRMSGGVFDEYSAPKSSRLRSQKYQKVSKELSSINHGNKVQVAGMNDTLINIWPFFFRSNEYWSALWPLVDKDPYGFAFRPFYNQEGDDYSILFPLSAWNPAERSGWVTLFAWSPNGFGFIPLTWQWKHQYSGGAYYTPLLFWTYDNEPLRYEVDDHGRVSSNWYQDELDLFCFLLYYGKEKRVSAGNWSWLYRVWYDKESEQEFKNMWNYYFKGKKPFPKDKIALEKFRQEIFASLPRITEKGYGFFPLWLGWTADNGDYTHRFMLICGMSRSENRFDFDILGDIFANYENIRYPKVSRYQHSKTSFESLALLSGFSTTVSYRQDDPKWRQLDALFSLVKYHTPFSQQRPKIENELKKLDPAIKLPDTVVDAHTYRLFLEELWLKYDFPTYKEHQAIILPLFWYNSNEMDDSYNWLLPCLLTGWGKDSGESYFNSLPLMTFISRTKTEDKTTVLTPLVFYSKQFHRERSNYPVFSRETKDVPEGRCVELSDTYAACGLFYRGKFGFNIAKEGYNASTVEALRELLISLPQTKKHLQQKQTAIDKRTRENDRWQTTTEIERLQKLIVYEEIKIDQAALARATADFQKETADALNYAKKLGLDADAESLADEKKADAIRVAMFEKCTELRFYEDIGNGLFFHKAKYYNGDNYWHFMHILAGGEKVGERESSHILHLLYRYRKEGNRTERVYFPFISTVTEGEDSRFSFMWRLFSISERNGKTGGYIFFIPFGSEW